MTAHLSAPESAPGPEVPTTRPRVDTIVVIVPARNEQTHLRACLTGIRNAAARVSSSLNVETVVAVNDSTDNTLDIAQGEGAHTVVSPVANVGMARAAGAAWALTRHTGRHDRLWLASTDADSIVPPQWLYEQRRLADGGADVFIGTITLSPAAAVRHRAWTTRYESDARRGRVHGHVHGANLGFSAAAYLAAGGFRPLTAHEDSDLVARLAGAGAALAWIDHVPVLTSARHRDPSAPGVGADLATSVIRIDPAELGAAG